MATFGRADHRSYETRMRDAALVLRALGPTAMASVLNCLKDDPIVVRRLYDGLTALNEEAAAQRDDVQYDTSLREAVQRMLETTGQSTAGSSGTSDAAALMDAFTSALSDQDACSLRGAGRHGELSSLARSLLLSPADQASQVLVDEHPQYAAALLAELPPPDAARLLARISTEQCAALLLRIACLSALPEKAIAWLATLPARRPDAAVSPRATAMRPRDSRCSVATLSHAARYDGEKHCARILMALVPDLQVATLRQMAAQAPDLSVAVRARMFEFQDLADLSPQFLQDVLREVDAGVVLRALQGAPAKVVGAFCDSLSRRGANALRQDLDDALELPDDEIRDAREELASVARRLCEDPRTISV